MNNKTIDNEFIKEIDRLEYGKILSLIGIKRFNYYNETSFIVQNKYFLDFCNNNIKDSKNAIIKLYNELEKIKEI